MREVGLHLQPGVDRVELDERLVKPTAVTDDVWEASKAIWQAGTTELGVWECTPGVFTARRDGFDEICVVLSGSAKIYTEGGESVSVTAGDAFVTPKGWAGVWHVTETLRKVYVTIVSRP